MSPWASALIVLGLIVVEGLFVGAEIALDLSGWTTPCDSLHATSRKGLIVNFSSVICSATDLDPIERGETVHRF